MSHQVTLVARVSDVLRGAQPTLPSGYVLRPSNSSDAEVLGRLYFDSYDPGVASANVEDALADIFASFDGEYGPYLFEASPVVEESGSIVGAVMVVERAPWPDTPDCPFVIDLFVDRAHRRHGLARSMLFESVRKLEEAGFEAVALRVLSDNTPARDLYRSLGFNEMP